MSRSIPFLFGLCALVLAGPPTLHAEDGSADTAKSDEAVSAEARDECIRRAMAYLDEAIWKLPEHGSSYKPYTAAVAGWAYLIAADRVKEGRRLPRRGRALRKIRDYLEDYVGRIARIYEKDDDRRRKGRPSRDEPDGAPDLASLMGPKQYVWSLGQVACFLSESIARRKRRRASKRLLTQVVAVLEACQQPDGGWGHDDASRPGMGLPEIRIPKPGGGSHTYPHTLLAASTCALAGLGAAHRALEVEDAPSARKARAYFAKAQNDGGTFPYDPSQAMTGERRERMGLPPGARSPLAGRDALGIARTSGAIYALLQAGESPKADVVRRGLEAVDEQPAWCCEGHGSATMALQYGGLLASARGGATWQRFRRIYFPRMLAAQQDDGSFDCIALGEAFGVTNDTEGIPGMGGANVPGLASLAQAARPYVTAIHVLLLVLDRSASQCAPNAPTAAEPVVTGR